MALNINALYNIAWGAVQRVSRERVGLIHSITRDARFDRAAQGEKVKVTITPPMPIKDVTFTGQFPTDNTSRKVETIDMEIDNFKEAEIHLTGEQLKTIDHASGRDPFIRQTIEQGVRNLTNGIENSVLTKALRSASRAYKNSTPLFSAEDSKEELTGLGLIFADQGAPMEQNHLVITNQNYYQGYIRNQDRLTEYDRSGDTELLRRGMVTKPDLGFMIKSSAQLGAHTPSNATGKLVNGAQAAGTTRIPIDGGSGTFNAGDVIRFAGDTNYYVVVDSDSNYVTIGAPGLRQQASDNAAITREGAFTPGFAYNRDSVVLATRVIAPAPVETPNQKMMVRDNITGIVYEFVIWGGVNVSAFQVRCAWGSQTVKPEWTNLLIA